MKVISFNKLASKGGSYHMTMKVVRVKRSRSQKMFQNSSFLNHQTVVVQNYYRLKNRQTQYTRVIRAAISTFRLFSILLFPNFQNEENPQIISIISIINQQTN